MRRSLKRAMAAGGLVGPASFVAAWSVLGATTAERYSPVHDAISGLAQMGAPTRGGMTAGLVAFGLGVPLFGLALRDELAGAAWATAVATGVATLAVGASPLQASKSVDLLHAASATVGYASIAATPWLAAPHLTGPASLLSRAAAGASGAALLAAQLGPATGLWQRVGLTVGDAWIVAMAVRMVRRP